MKEKRDKSQYGNQKNLSTQHYLVKMLHKILTSVDKNSKNEAFCAIVHLVDWSQAFDRQSHKLGVQSFIENGVRPALIPVLVNFFQERKMRVKWKGHLSTLRKLNGGGPQGGTLGIEEYLSQSNDNTDFLKEDGKFKFIDDLSFLEIIYLVNVGIASYNIYAHVPSDVPTHNQIISKENLKSQEFLSKINNWTEKQKMKLNDKKTKNMIFNFSKKNQFITKLSVNDNNLEVVEETKLLGTVLTNNLSWNRNTEELVKRGFRRMNLLFKAAKFTNSKEDLKAIYLTYIRSIIEQSSVVWHSSLTKRNRNDLERVQKAAAKVIMGKNYTTYKNALKFLRMTILIKEEKNYAYHLQKNV